MNPETFKAALCAAWPDDQERATRTLDLFLGLLEAGRWKTATDLMRVGGIPESSVWDLVEQASEEMDTDAGEIFALLYEPDGLRDG